MIELRTIDTGRRAIEIPTVDGLEVRCVGRRTDLRGAAHPGYLADPDWLVTRDGANLEGSAGEFRGHPAVFDSPTWIGPPQFGFEEVVARSAFTKTIADGADVRFVRNHDPNILFARVASGTLNLSTDKRGLFAAASIADTSHGRDEVVLLERGDVSQMSFAFRAIKEQWDLIEPEDRDAYERRTLLEVALVDVSTVTWPAYDDTDAGLLRSAYENVGVAKATKIADSETKPPTSTSPDTPTVNVARARFDQKHKDTN